MKLNYAYLCLSIFIVGCQAKPDNSANEAFEKNSKTVLSYLDGMQNEGLDYDAFFSNDFVLRGTSFGAKDSFNLEQVKENDAEGWAKYDFEIITDPLVLLPGVSVETKKADGSVRYYASWKVTLSATDSTEAKSGVIKLYESFDFDNAGKIIYQQYYGDITGLFNSLNHKE
jgi:hypothetical protein